jgi:hypothetical protein
MRDVLLFLSSIINVVVRVAASPQEGVYAL